MAHTYLLFDFGADEEKAQQARHKLEGWKQAFRLDKKLQFKFDRGEVMAAQPAQNNVEAEREKSKAKTEEKSERKTKSKSSGSPSEKNGNVKLLVRLYFSAHEKLSEKRWIERIPGEEPFKNALPKVVQEGEAGFPELLKQFDTLD